MHLDDTIVAIATPPGRGGIGVVRLAGPQSVEVARQMVRVGGAADQRPWEPRHAMFAELVEPASGERIDEVVVTWFAKPHSYTTDDVVEISCHGAPVVLRHAVDLALQRGARLAQPGEFTMRAFLNGRLDLTQAEAVRDLIDSQTLYQAKVAAQQLDGSLSHRLQPIKAELVKLIALLEAGIDFAEDDVAVMPAEQIAARIAAIREPLLELERSFAFGKIVHEGFTLAIVGRPNVGKSSLFNRLVERERAIVTATPGTTRDLVTETVALGGIPVHLVDTAGIRHAVEEAEYIGISKSMEALADADLVLVVLDVSQPLDAVDRELLDQTRNRPAVVVHNKSDMTAREVSAGNVTARLSDAPTSSGQLIRAGDDEEQPVVATSALTGEGLDLLRHKILELVKGDSGTQQESGFLTNLRQHDLVRKTLTALDAADEAVETRVPHEMLLLDLYSALRALDKITGATTADDILNLIFSTFCIGK